MRRVCDGCGRSMDGEIEAIDAADGRATLFSADFRSIGAMIAAGSVDAVITDPPYGSGGFMLRDVTRSAKAKYVSSDASYQKTLPDIDGDALRPEAWRGLMEEACLFSRRVLRDGGLFALFIDWRNLPVLAEVVARTGLMQRGTVAWDKGLGARPIRNGFRNQAEYLLWGTKGPMPARDPAVYLPGVLRHATKNNGKLHITEKPLALMREIVELCPPGGLIADPFMGSGTTGVAALQSGRRFIGVESVPAIYDTARDRIAAEWQRLRAESE